MTAQSSPDPRSSRRRLYLDKAEELRAKAEAATTSLARRELVFLSDFYERMAEHYEDPSQ